MVDYTKSWSKKQWTRRTEGVFKNIIDALRESRMMPGGLINPSEPEIEDFLLIVDPTRYTAPPGIATTKVFSVCIHAVQNWAGTVTLSQTNNLCAGATVSIDDTTVAVDAETPKNCTYMRLSLPADCPVGVYRITVTGVSGSITKTAEVKIGVGVSIEDEEPWKCTIDEECKEKYGDDYWCVGGECLKACGTAEANCNSDYCTEDEKCIWNAAAGKCFCRKQGFTLSCGGIITIPVGEGKMGYGSIVITSVNGFSGSGSVYIYDEHQPGQAPSDCLTAWVRYGSGSGNIVPVTLPADGSIVIGVEVASNCLEEGDHYFGVEVSIGGKTAACVIMVRVKSTGIWYFTEYQEGLARLHPYHNPNCGDPLSGGYGCCRCNDDCRAGSYERELWAAFSSEGFTGDVIFTVSAKPKCCFFHIDWYDVWCEGDVYKCEGFCGKHFSPTSKSGRVSAHGDQMCTFTDCCPGYPASCGGPWDVPVHFHGEGGGITQDIVVYMRMPCVHYP